MNGYKRLILWLLASFWIPANAQKVTYIHTDALGSPVLSTNVDRAVIERSEYEPYGKVLNRPLQDSPGYTGHVEDSATGLNYMQQRYYDPSVGRFLSVDPVTAFDNADMRHFNRYWYGNGNPYRFIDPDGRASDNADRQPRAGSTATATSPDAERQISSKGGAPTRALTSQMKSGVNTDRESAALAAMAIGKVRGDASTLVYSPDLKGIAAGTASPDGVVEVGPDAFISWGFLMSNLAHEYEVHIRQYEQLGPLQGMRDTARREVEAHQYSVDNAGRFKLTPAEVRHHERARDGYQREATR